VGPHCYVSGFHWCSHSHRFQCRQCPVAVLWFIWVIVILWSARKQSRRRGMRQCVFASFVSSLSPHHLFSFDTLNSFVFVLTPTYTMKYLSLSLSKHYPQLGEEVLWCRFALVLSKRHEMGGVLCCVWVGSAGLLGGVWWRHWAFEHLAHPWEIVGKYCCVGKSTHTYTSLFISICSLLWFLTK
jgi:hypothetical protein